MFYCSLFLIDFQAETAVAPSARASSVFSPHTGTSANAQWGRAMLWPIHSSRGGGHPPGLPRKRQRKRERAPFRYREVGRKSRGRRKSFISKPKAFQMRLRFQFNNWSTVFPSQIKTGNCVMKINCIFCILKIFSFTYTLESRFFWYWFENI